MNEVKKNSFLHFSVYGQKNSFKDYPIQPVNFTKVKVNDHFWASRIELNQKVTIPIALDQCYKTGRVENFKIAGETVPFIFVNYFVRPHCQQQTLLHGYAALPPNW